MWYQISISFLPERRTDSTIEFKFPMFRCDQEEQYYGAKYKIEKIDQNKIGKVIPKQVPYKVKNIYLLSSI